MSNVYKKSSPFYHALSVLCGASSYQQMQPFQAQTSLRHDFLEGVK